MKIAFVLDMITAGQVPMGIGIIAALLKKHGHEVVYLPLPSEQEAWKIKDTGAQVVAYSTTTGLHKLYLKVNRKLKKECSIFSVFGGAHPTVCPDLIEEEGVDAICIGEGEYPMLDLVTTLEKGEEPRNIQNIIYKDIQGNIHKNPTRPFIKDLDELPFPDLDIIDTFQDITRFGVANIMAGRGCPYGCTFCINKYSKTLQKGQYVRMRNAENVLEEIRETRNRYDVKFVAFIDDTFTLYRDWLFDFLGRYKSQVGLPFLINTRADALDEETAKKLSEAGCKNVVIGLETGNDEIRNTIMNKQLTSEQIINASILIKKYNMELFTQNLIGVPGETPSTVLSTVKLNMRCKSDILSVHYYQPYPGTKLTEITNEKGLYTGTVDDIPGMNHWRISLNLENRNEIQALGRLIFFMIDYPFFYYLIRLMRIVVPIKYIRLHVYKYLMILDEKLINTPKRKLGCRWTPPFEPTLRVPIEEPLDKAIEALFA